jgi:hypothetical protein
MADRNYVIYLPEAEPSLVKGPDLNRDCQAGPHLVGRDVVRLLLGYNVPASDVVSVAESIALQEPPLDQPQLDDYMRAVKAVMEAE